MALTLITGKSWTRSFRRRNNGQPVPFIEGDVLRAQLREKPTDSPIDVFAEIISAAE